MCKDFVVCWWEYTMLYLPPKNKKILYLGERFGGLMPLSRHWCCMCMEHGDGESPYSLSGSLGAWMLIFSCFRVVRVFGKEV